jgi:Flp pilus assembly protein TadG
VSSIALSFTLASQIIMVDQLLPIGEPVTRKSIFTPTLHGKGGAACGKGRDWLHHFLYSRSTNGLLRGEVHLRQEGVIADSYGIKYMQYLSRPSSRLARIRKLVLLRFVDGYLDLWEWALTPRDIADARISVDRIEAPLWSAGTIAWPRAESQWWNTDGYKSMTGSAEPKLTSCSQRKGNLRGEMMFCKRASRFHRAGASRLLWRGQEGQSLIEVALMVPIFTILICYAVDFGFFFLVATSLNSAARNAMEYAIQGTSSPAQAAEPSATVVSNLAIASIGLAGASTGSVSIRICSSAVGVTASNNTAQCTTASTGAGAVTGTPDTDPESPKFQLNRVDVVYTVTPPIPMPVSIFPTRTFHRMVEMRAIQ